MIETTNILTPYLDMIAIGFTGLLALLLMIILRHVRKGRQYARMNYLEMERLNKKMDGMKEEIKLLTKGMKDSDKAWLKGQGK